MKKPSSSRFLHYEFRFLVSEYEIAIEFPIIQQLVAMNHTMVFDYVFEDMKMLPRTGKMDAI